MKRISRSASKTQCSTIDVDLLRRLDGIFDDVQIANLELAEVDQHDREFLSRAAAQRAVEVKFHDNVEAEFSSCIDLSSSDLFLDRRIKAITVKNATTADIKASVFFGGAEEDKPTASYAIEGPNDNILSIADRLERVIASANNHYQIIRSLSISKGYGMLVVIASAILFAKTESDESTDGLFSPYVETLGWNPNWIWWFVASFSVFTLLVKDRLYPIIEADFATSDSSVPKRMRNAISFAVTLALSALVPPIVSAFL